MSSSLFDDKRRVVPIWRTYSSALRSRELQPINSPYRPQHIAHHVSHDPLHRMLEESESHWRRDRSIDTACDIVGLALIVGRRDIAHDAATFLLSQPDQVADGPLFLAQSAISEHPRNFDLPPDASKRTFDSATAARDKRRSGHSLSIARMNTRTNPNNGIAWSDLALAFAEVGKLNDAEKAARTAYGLAPKNRLVTRNLARMLIHANDVEQAHHFLRRCPRTPHDPWLIAAELSTAQILNRPARYMKDARKKIDKNMWDPFSTSELAAALATSFYRDGSTKRAHKVLRASLQDPSDNAVAQAEWLVHHKYASPEIESLLRDTSVPEARAMRNKASDQFEEALRRYAEWLDYEPYSTRPAIAGSFVSSVALGDASATIYFCLRGIAANRNEWLLWNNLAVGYFLNGEIHTGTHALRRARELAFSAEDGATLDATEGLRLYRQGCPQEGRIFYEKAIDHFRRSGRPTSLRLAILYLLQEEGRQQQSNVPEQLISIATREPPDSPELRRMAERISNQYKLLDMRLK